MGVRGMVRQHSKKPFALSEELKDLGTPLYYTDLGAAYVGDSRELLKKLPSSFVDLVVTSPPFPLQRPKEYGTFAFEYEFVEWFEPFAREVKRVLKDSGSFVIDLGGVYVKGRPVKSLYPYRLLIKLVDELGFVLAQEFFWFNPSKLPSPIEWVNKRKIRVKDSVNLVFWLAKQDFPKANVENVLIDYSDRMRQLLRLRERFYRPKERPSGHYVSERFMILEPSKGAIPPNLLVIPNTDSNSPYLQACRKLNLRPNPARFPEELPEFFIRFLTDEGDIVLDIFAGSNTTGYVAERLNRRWLAFEIDREYLVASMARFIPLPEFEQIYQEVKSKGIREGIYLKSRIEIKAREEYQMSIDEFY
ncbi:MAG: site-specific DNA-methyltransferase [Thermofilum sp.]|jgi:site-specific DNA-methyltransferase (cytosine-N4-specific)|nr:site-specific DNA-methyltransferase [Thermofilum sp.]